MLGSAFDENTLQWKKTVEIGTESAILVQVLSLCLFVCLFVFNYGKMVVIKMLNAMYVHNSTRKNVFIILLYGMWEGKLKNVQKEKLHNIDYLKTP